MSLNLSTASLRSLIVLTEKRDNLQSELASLEAEISAVLGGSARPAFVRAGKAKAAPSPVARPARKRGAVKELILSALKEAGHAGIAVKDLSSKLGLKNTSLHVWFGTTGKGIREIEKAGKGIYRFVTGAPAEEKPAEARKAPVKKAVAVKKPKAPGIKKAPVAKPAPKAKKSK